MMKTYAVPSLGAAEPSVPPVQTSQQGEEKKSRIEQLILKGLSLLRRLLLGLWHAFVFVCDQLLRLLSSSWGLSIATSDRTRHKLLKLLGRRERIFKDNKERSDRNDRKFKEVWPLWILSALILGAVTITRVYGRVNTDWHAVWPSVLRTEIYVAAFWLFVVWLRYHPKSSVWRPRGER